MSDDLPEVTSETLQEWTPEVCDIARKAGKLLRQKFHSGEFTVEYKEDNSPVTTADYEAHDILFEAISELTPTIPIISEENKVHPEIDEKDLFWTYDPLDGTQNFVDSKENFYVKIALIDDGEPVIGVIYVPMHDTIYFSWKDGPAFKQVPGKEPQIMKVKTLADGETPKILSFDKYTARPSFQAAVKKLSERGINVDLSNPIAGGDAPDYMCIADGEEYGADLYINCGRDESLIAGNGFSWDYAPDILILRNAGGDVQQIHDGSAPSVMPPTEPMNAMIGISGPEVLKP